MKTHALAMLAFVLSNSIALAEDSVCAPLLAGGVFDKADKLDLVYRIEATKAWLCRDSIKTKDQADHFDSNATIPIEGVLWKFGLKNDYSNFEEAKDKFCSEDSRFLALNESLKESYSKVNQGLVDAFVRCIENNIGLHGWLELSDERLFAIRYEYRSKVRPYATIVRHFTANPKGVVVCREALRPGNAIDGGGVVINCERNDTSKAVQITLETDHGTNTLKFAPELPKLKIRDLPPATGITRMSRSADQNEAAFLFHDGQSGATSKPAVYDQICVQAHPGWVLQRSSFKFSPSKVSAGCFVLCEENAGNDKISDPEPDANACKKGNPSEASICFAARMSVNAGETCEIKYTVTGREVEVPR